VADCRRTRPNVPLLVVALLLKCAWHGAIADLETVGSEEPSRYRLGSLMETVRLPPRERPSGMRFTILVFSFTSKDAGQRYRMQQILRHFGFKRFAQNAYANVNFEDSGFRRVLEQEGLSENAFLFTHADDGDAELTARLIALWSPERIAESMKRFALELEAFFDDAPIEDGALFCRFFYAGAAYYEHFTVRLPNIPEGMISGEAPLTRIEKLLADFQACHRDRLIGYYCRVNS
jgi:DNA-binding transcriptional regulator PaaX